MKKYLVIRDGVVENIILWDGVAHWPPPEGTTVLECPPDLVIDIGDSFGS